MEGNVGAAEGKNLPTVDEKEILHFSQMTKIWWDTTGLLSGLHTMNSLRVPFIEDCLIETGIINKEKISNEKPLEGILILDVGCGGGILSEAIARRGGLVTGIDMCDDLINVAKSHANLDSTLKHLKFIATSIEEHSTLFPEKYDVVVCSEVIEHVAVPDKLLEFCVKCLKPGGSVIITTWNKTFTSWWKGIIVLENILKGIPRGTHQWSKFISPSDVTMILEKRNCCTKSVRGMKFELFPILRRWWWSEDISVVYGLHAVKNY